MPPTEYDQIIWIRIPYYKHRMSILDCTQAQKVSHARSSASRRSASMAADALSISLAACIISGSVSSRDGANGSPSFTRRDVNVMRFMPYTI